MRRINVETSQTEAIYLPKSLIDEYQFDLDKTKVINTEYGIIIQQYNTPPYETIRDSALVIFDFSTVPLEYFDQFNIEQKISNLVKNCKVPQPFTIRLIPPQIKSIPLCNPDNWFIRIVCDFWAKNYWDKAVKQEVFASLFQLLSRIGFTYRIRFYQRRFHTRTFHSSQRLYVSNRKVKLHKGIHKLLNGNKNTARASLLRNFIVNELISLRPINYPTLLIDGDGNIPSVAEQYGLENEVRYEEFHYVSKCKKLINIEGKPSIIPKGNTIPDTLKRVQAEENKVKKNLPQKEPISINRIVELAEIKANSKDFDVINSASGKLDDACLYAHLIHIKRENREFIIPSALISIVTFSLFCLLNNSTIMSIVFLSIAIGSLGFSYQSYRKMLRINSTFTAIESKYADSDNKELDSDKENHSEYCYGKFSR